ncbi:MAG: MptD family putative ECF transporter S component [Propioniciclava sp.]
MTTATPTKRRTLSGRDLINAGIFTAIYFVIMFGMGMIGLAGPAGSLLGYALGILANGVVVALYLARVPKVGALTLLAFIVSVLMTLTGHPWYSIIVTPLLGLVADLVAKSGHYRNPGRNTVAYAVLTLWYLVPMLPAVWDSVGYTEYVTSSMGEEYAEGYMAIFNGTNLIFIGVGFFVLGLIGGWFGQRMVRKHFRRAGVA